MIQNEIELAQQREQRKRLVDKETAIIIEAGLRIISFRVLTVLSILGNMGIFGWAMYEPRWERIVTAALFGVVTWFLTRFKGTDQAG